jgi:hypothetical protein
MEEGAPVLNCYDTKPRYQRRRCGVGLCYDIRSNSMEGRGVYTSDLDGRR